jgi:hypothetical protein
LEGVKASLLNQTVINEKLLNASSLKENELQAQLIKESSNNDKKISISKQNESELKAVLLKQGQLNESHLKVIDLKEIKISAVSLELEILKNTLLKETSLNERVLKESLLQESLLHVEINNLEKQSIEELLKLQNINAKILLESQLQENELQKVRVQYEFIKEKSLKEIQELENQIENGDLKIKSINDELIKQTTLNTSSLKDFDKKIKDLKSSLSKEIGLKNAWHDESLKNRGLLNIADANNELHRDIVIKKNKEHRAMIHNLTQQQLFEIEKTNDNFNREWSKQRSLYETRLQLERQKHQGLIRDLRLAQNDIAMRKKAEELKLQNEKKLAEDEKLQMERRNHQGLIRDLRLAKNDIDMRKNADEIKLENAKKLAEEQKLKIDQQAKQRVRDIDNARERRLLKNNASQSGLFKKRRKRDASYDNNNGLIKSTAYFYSNICEHQIVGSDKARLLQVLSLNNRTTHINQPQYVPVALNRIPRIEILIKDSDGESFPFEDGTSILKLHFKEVLQQ